MPRRDAKPENRRFSRVSFQIPAELRAGGRVLACSLIDVSLRGALLELPAGTAIPEGEACTLEVRLGGDARIEMRGKVAHRESARAGIRCESIDLDSIAHLRRLVELNLGDEELMHRELAALIRRP